MICLPKCTYIGSESRHNKKVKPMNGKQKEKYIIPITSFYHLIERRSTRWFEIEFKIRIKFKIDASQVNNQDWKYCFYDQNYSFDIYDHEITIQFET